MQAISTPQRRLRILGDDEIDALYGRPRFTPDERVHYFGYYCPSPENVKSAHMGFLLLLQNLAPVHRIDVTGRQRIKVHG